MIDPGSDSWNYVAAMFSYEFLGGGVEYDTIERIHRGEVDEWVHALLQSGMFESATVAAIADSWRAAPRRLFDMLVLDADEMTARRCSLAWSSLDRLAPLEQVQDRRVDPAVGLAVEVFRPQELGDLDHGIAIDEDGAEHGLLGLEALRRKAVDHRSPR